MQRLSVFALLALLCLSYVGLSVAVTGLSPIVSDVNSAVMEAEHALDAFAEEDSYAAAAAENDENIFLEIEAAAESMGEGEGESDLEEAFGLDESSQEDALFMELDSESYTDADSDAEGEVWIRQEIGSDIEASGKIHVDNSAVVQGEAEADAELMADAEAGSLTVTQVATDHEQDTDPIVTEQMEMSEALEEYGAGLLETGAETDADAEVEADADADAEAEVDAEAEKAPKAKEDNTGTTGTAYTGCGKKITWIKKQIDPLPEKK